MRRKQKPAGFTGGARTIFPYGANGHGNRTDSVRIKADIACTRSPSCHRR